MVVIILIIGSTVFIIVIVVRFVFNCFAILAVSLINH